MNKYNINAIEALKIFVCSNTHNLLEDIDNGLLMFGASGIFDIWESEKNTGDPKSPV